MPNDLATRAAAFLALAEKATEGPWVLKNNELYIGVKHENGTISLYSHIFLEDVGDFISESRTLLPKALARIEKLEEALNLISGLPKTISITSVEIREALHDPVQTIVDASKTTLEQTPPELAADLIDRGIVMAGGGSLLRGLDKRIAEETGLPVHIADDPLPAVVMGTGQVVNMSSRLKRRIVVETKLDF